MARVHVPPDAYKFLLAAGEIDFFHSDKRSANARICGKELLRISRMNGSYESLPADFRADMQVVAKTACDEETASRLGEIGDMLLRLKSLTEDERVALRARCSELSKYWPMRPRVLLV
jgi:hypothetical protein